MTIWLLRFQEGGLDSGPWAFMFWCVDLEYLFFTLPLEFSAKIGLQSSSGHSWKCLRGLPGQFLFMDSYRHTSFFCIVTDVFLLLFCLNCGFYLRYPNCRIVALESRVFFTIILFWWYSQSEIGWPVWERVQGNSLNLYAKWKGPTQGVHVSRMRE